MHAVLIANVIGFGFMFVIWSKKSLLNVAFKLAFLGLLVANIIQLTKL